jgi:ATP synthase F1 gamma subunit
MVIGQDQKTLCIVIGSQKGLCGSFNAQLEPVFNLFQQNTTQPGDIALIGAQVIKNKVFSNKQNVVYSETQFTQKTSHSILHHLKTLLNHYHSVVVISNHFKTFFLQEAMSSTILPLENNFDNNTQAESVYLCDEEATEIHAMLLQKYTDTQLSFLLYQSLLAEHAARFSSMDAANRNAKTMLDETKIKYNKLRQTKITTEINELSANFSQN